MTSEEFVREIDQVGYDGVRDRQINDQRPLSLSLEDLKKDFSALKDHCDGHGDMFYDTVPPTDKALLMIFAFLVLP